MSKEYSIETKCIQSGWHPKNGEPRVLPIYQSTTYKYETSDEMGKLFDLEKEGYFYTRLQNPTNDMVAEKNLRIGGWRGSDADFIRPGSKLLCGI